MCIRDSIAKRAKEEIGIKYILDLREFPDSPFADKFTKSFDDIVNDPEVRVVVEVMGGLHPAFEYTMPVSYTHLSMIGPDHNDFTHNSIPTFLFVP